MSVESFLASANQDQVAMMEERVILVDENDNVRGHASKKECTSTFGALCFWRQHSRSLCVAFFRVCRLALFFSPPRSSVAAHLNAQLDEMLHRAFSVFLFTPDNKLILQKVWPAEPFFFRLVLICLARRVAACGAQW